MVREYTAAPVYFGEDQGGAHEWMIEFEQEPSSMQEFIIALDTKLKEINSDYDAKRAFNFVMREPVVKKLPQGTFYGWMKHHGKLGGQHKVPRLSNDRKLLEDIYRFSCNSITSEIGAQ